MPGGPAPVYVRHTASASTGRLRLPGGDDLHRELLEENARLRVENARLAEENATLREAAGLWIRLYETQLERANRAVQQES